MKYFKISYRGYTAIVPETDVRASYSSGRAHIDLKNTSVNGLVSFDTEASFFKRIEDHLDGLLPYNVLSMTEETYKYTNIRTN
jgi:hypothetical protein